MNKPEDTKRFDRKTNNDYGKWIQDGLKIIRNN